MEALVGVCTQKTNVIIGWGMDPLVIGCTRNTRYYGLGMDALVIRCTRNANVIMVWAWMLW